MKYSEKQIRRAAEETGIAPSTCERFVEILIELNPPKVKKDPDECFGDFKEYWLKEFPQFKLEFNGASAKALNSIIGKCRKWLLASQRVDSKEKMLAMFAYLIAYVKRTSHWVSGKGLNVWDQKLIEIFTEMFNGKRITKVPSTRERINSL
jgi:hypothetical protein